MYSPLFTTVCLSLLDCPATWDLTMMLDASGSITYKRFHAVVEFVIDLVKYIPHPSDPSDPTHPTSTHIALQTYDDVPHTYINLGDTFTDIFHLLGALNVPYSSHGRSFTDRALATLHTDIYTPTAGDRAGIPDLVILFTDGHSQDPVSTLKWAESARAAGMTFIVVLLGKDAGTQEALDIVGPSGTHRVFHVQDYHDLSSIRSQVLEIICSP